MINNYMKVEGRNDLIRDPYSKAILNCNYEKLNSVKNIKELSNKYNILENEIHTIKNNILDIKKLLENALTNKEEKNNGN